MEGRGVYYILTGPSPLRGLLLSLCLALLSVYMLVTRSLHRDLAVTNMFCKCGILGVIAMVM